MPNGLSGPLARGRATPNPNPSPSPNPSPNPNPNPNPSPNPKVARENAREARETEREAARLELMLRRERGNLQELTSRNASRAGSSRSSGVANPTARPVTLASNPDPSF